MYVGSASFQLRHLPWAGLELAKSPHQIRNYPCELQVSPVIIAIAVALIDGKKCRQRYSVPSEHAPISKHYKSASCLASVRPSPEVSTRKVYVPTARWPATVDRLV